MISRIEQHEFEMDEAQTGIETTEAEIARLTEEIADLREQQEMTRVENNSRPPTARDEIPNFKGQQEMGRGDADSRVNQLEEVICC